MKPPLPPYYSACSNHRNQVLPLLEIVKGPPVVVAQPTLKEFQLRRRARIAAW